MGRVKAILQSEFPYNISARCINREWFNIPLAVVWEIFCEELSQTHLDHGWNIHSFVLMTNHFHLIASTPEANVSQCMHQFMTRTSKRLTREGNRINETFAGRHFKCILQEYSYYLCAYKYNYRNPVAAGICKNVEDYQFSSLHTKLKLAKSKIPLIDDTLLNEDPTGILDWLNKAPNPEKLEAVRWGFKKQFFESKKNTNNNRPIFSVNDTL